MTFGEVLRKERSSKKMSLRDLAESLDISFSALGKYERNENQPDFDTLIRIADFFDVSVDYMLGRSSLKRVNGIDFISHSKDFNDDIRKLEPEQQRNLTAFLNNCYLIIERQVLVKYDERLLKRYEGIVRKLMYMDAYIDGYLENPLIKSKKKFDINKVKDELKLNFYGTKEEINKNLDELFLVYVSNVISEIEDKGGKSSG